MTRNQDTEINRVIRIIETDTGKQVDAVRDLYYALGECIVLLSTFFEVGSLFLFFLPAGSGTEYIVPVIRAILEGRLLKLLYDIIATSTDSSLRVCLGSLRALCFSIFTLTTGIGHSLGWCYSLTVHNPLRFSWGAPCPHVYFQNHPLNQRWLRFSFFSSSLSSSPSFYPSHQTF